MARARFELATLVLDYYTKFHVSQLIELELYHWRLPHRSTLMSLVSFAGSDTLTKLSYLANLRQKIRKSFKKLAKIKEEI